MSDKAQSPCAAAPAAGNARAREAVAESVSIRLDDDQLVALADMLAARLRGAVDRAADDEAGSLVDAGRLARKLGVSRATVYEHSAELGAVEVGEGDRPRLRFDPDRALEAWTRRSAGRRSQVVQARSGTGVPRYRQRRRLGSGAPLLPIRGDSEGLAPDHDKHEGDLDAAA